MSTFQYPMNRFAKPKKQKIEPFALAPYRCPVCKSSHNYYNKADLLAIITHAQTALKKLEDN